MDKLKKVLSGQDAEDRGGLSEVAEATSLSSGTRIKGFIACFAAGILCSLLGTFLLWVPQKGLYLFAVFYTFGNIASIGRAAPVAFGGSQARGRISAVAAILYHSHGNEGSKLSL